MIKLAYCNVENLNLNKAYKLVSKDRQSKILSYKFDRDKKLSAGVYLLLKKLLNEESIFNPIFKVGEYGKAYISNYEDIYFNLSHSNDYVLCGISDKDIGVDIEYVDNSIDLDIAKNYFFNDEYFNILNSKVPYDEFFNYWVLKESYMKYTGLGFHLKLDSFSINIDDEIKLNGDNNTVKFSLFDIDNYKVACAGKYFLDTCVEYSVEDLY